MPANLWIPLSNYVSTLFCSYLAVNELCRQLKMDLEHEFAMALLFEFIFVIVPTDTYMSFQFLIRFRKSNAESFFGIAVSLIINIVFFLGSCGRTLGKDSFVPIVDDIFLEMN